MPVAATLITDFAYRWSIINKKRFYGIHAENVHQI